MNRQATIEAVTADQVEANSKHPEFGVGDTLDVHVRIIEGEKERVQVYQGVLIGMKGRGINRTITVRRIVANEGVERIFPLHSPRIAKIEVVRRGVVFALVLPLLRCKLKHHLVVVLSVILPPEFDHLFDAVAIIWEAADMMAHRVLTRALIFGASDDVHPSDF